MATTTPMMAQYRQIKRDHRDAILFYRLGDFYEMFDEDAAEAAELLEIALTSRNGVPMCGVPHHAARSYIGRLLKLGRRVAVCEQTSLPANGRGLAERQVVEVVTPGTVLDEELLDGATNNFLVAIGTAGGRRAPEQVTLAALDVSTGEFRCTAFPRAGAAARVGDELARMAPRELLVQESLLAEDQPVARVISQQVSATAVINRYPDWHFDPGAGYERLCALFGVANLKGFGLEPDAAELAVAGLLAGYAEQTAMATLRHVRSIVRYGAESNVLLDEAAQRSLELVRNLEDGSRERTLLAVVDQTCTAMGARQVQRALLAPLTDQATIERRLGVVAALFEQQTVLSAVRQCLRHVADLERLAGRLALSRATPRDLRALANSIGAIQDVAVELTGDRLQEEAEALRRQLDALEPQRQRIDEALVDEAPLSAAEGGIVRPGHDAEIDRLRATAEGAGTVLERYLEEERERTGIGNLRLRHNRVLGWFFEVTKSQLGRVPERFQRRQSLVNAERYATERLGELDREMAGANERLVEMERQAFVALCEALAPQVSDMLALGQRVARLDMLQGFALAATVGGYTRPRILPPGGGLHIREGRHPVVEGMLPAGAFVPNDLDLSADGTLFVVLTGPNMAGKSTFLRQTALIVLLAQVGSFVPASDAVIGLVDGIFCRIGASDNLARGESTFLVEMNETARILHAATAHSLVILDEIGRGTSTEDGLAIAWAVCEHLLDHIGAQTLFATHLRELTRIDHPAAANFAMEVVDDEQGVVFLKRVRPGAASHSYGVHVAALAGVPAAVVERARALLQELGGDGGFKAPVPPAPAPAAPPPGAAAQVPGVGDRADYQQPGLFSDHELVGRAVAAVDVESTSPLQALQLLVEWQRQLHRAP